MGSNTDLSGATTTTTHCDALGPVLSQHVVNHNVIDTTYGADDEYGYFESAYDGAGNLRGYQTTTSGGGGDTIVTQYTIATELLDGYKAQSVTRRQHQPEFG